MKVCKRRELSAVNCWPLVSDAGALEPPHCTVVCDEKYPPTTFTPRVVPPDTSVSGVTATTAGRDGTTVKPCGPCQAARDITVLRLHDQPHKSGYG